MSRSIAVFGAGPGLGQAVARRYAREGYAVTLPEYNNHGDVLNEYWPRLTEERPDFQFHLTGDDDEILARARCIPLRWDGTLQDLPGGIDGAIARGFDEGGANVLCALVIMVPRDTRAWRGDREACGNAVWGRTPGTLAMSAATLGQVCGGRYLLGLGASTKALVEGFHDTAFEHPAAKLREVVTSVRALLAGQPAQLSQAQAARPLRLGQPPAPEIPIWVAALGHHTTRVAAELGDGWIPALVARDRLAAWAAELNTVREAAAPHARPLTVAAGPITAVGENADAARDLAAGCIAWYLGAMGEVYARSVSGQGYAGQVQAILAANPRPSPQRGTVPPAGQLVLDQLAAYGTCDQVREQLRSWDRVADIVTILLPPGMPWPGIEATLHAAAPNGPALLRRLAC